MDLGSMIIIGVAVSLFVQFLKRLLQTNALGTYLIVFAVSLGVGTFYVLFESSVWWQNFVKVLMAAGSVYTFIISRFEKKPTD